MPNYEYRIILLPIFSNPLDAKTGMQDNFSK